MQKFVFDKTMVNNHLLALNKNLEQHRKVKKTLLSYLEKLSNSLYDDFNSKDTDFLLTLLAEAHMLFENIKLNINKLVELKMFLENVSKSEYLNTIDFERYHNEYSELFEKISDANASYLSFMNNYKMTLGVKDSEEIFEPSIFDIPSEENNNISSNDNIDIQEENIETSEVSNNIEDAVDTEIPEEPNISKTTDAIVFIDDTDDGIVNPDEFTFVEVPDTTSVEKTADDNINFDNTDIVSTILEDSIEQADDILLIDTTDDGVVNPDTVVLIENVDESPKQEEKNSSNDLNKKENLIIDSIVKKIMQITDSIPTITDFYTTTTIENSDLPEEEKIDLNISKKPDVENTTTNVYDNLKEESKEITNVEENIPLEDNLAIEEEPSLIETLVEEEVIEENNEEIVPVSDETENVAEEVVEENNEEIAPVSDEVEEIVEEVVEENNEEIVPVSDETEDVAEEVVEENNEEIAPVSDETEDVAEEVVEEVAEEIVEEEINEETEFSQEQLEEKTLVICKDDDIAILPYSFTDLEEFFSDNPEKYSSIQDIIEQEYTVSLKDYENTSFARYKEAYKLAKDKSNLSLPQSVTYAKKLLLENDVLPIVIASCKNIDELDNYLDCLDSNKLEDFKYFKIIEK